MSSATDPAESLCAVTDLPLGRDDVFEIFGPALSDPGRLAYPQSDADFDGLGSSIESLRARADHTAIVLVDGAFDVPQPNHEWYLRHCRLLGAKLLLDKQGLPSSKLFLQDTVASDAVSVVVTVDADAKISHKKSGLAEKGGVSRPIYPWQLRAERIAGLTFETGGGVRPLVDIVTVEGDPDHEGTPLESSLTLAVFMTRCQLLDGLVVYGEHQTTVSQARDMGINTMVIPGRTNYAVDPRNGRPWSSSDFIRRAQGLPG